MTDKIKKLEAELQRQKRLAIEKQVNELKLKYEGKYFLYKEKNKYTNQLVLILKFIKTIGFLNFGSSPYSTEEVIYCTQRDGEYTYRYQTKEEPVFTVLHHWIEVSSCCLENQIPCSVAFPSFYDSEIGS